MSVDTTEARERIEARIRHGGGCQECEDMRALLDELEATKREMHARELHHFEAETALTKIKRFVLSAQEYGDELDPEDILRMIPEDC